MAGCKFKIPLVLVAKNLAPGNIYIITGEISVDFGSYLGQAWSDHATQPQQVADGFSMGASLINAPEQIPQMVTLVTHVIGEHLGQWESGEVFLNSLKSNSFYVAGTDSEKAIKRAVASLRLAGGDSEVIKSFGPSDQIRICAVAASALNNKNIDQAQALFSQAMTLAEKGLDKNDPAARALAVTGNNLASALEDRLSRTPGETKLMIAAAHAGRKFWELAGTWVEVQAAEYRLAMTYMAAGDGESAHQHAKKCVDMGLIQADAPMEMFYAYEVLALSERARGNFPGFKIAAEKGRSYYDQLGPEDKRSCEDSMKKLKLS